MRWGGLPLPGVAGWRRYHMGGERGGGGARRPPPTHRKDKVEEGDRQAVGERLSG